jgi:hypothetical protein
VEDKMKESKACGAERLIALDGELAKAEPKMLRFRIFSAPARHVLHALNRVLKIPPGWAWVDDLATAWERDYSLHPS